jgi:maleamate amidohydrolase
MTAQNAPDTGSAPGSWRDVMPAGAYESFPPTSFAPQDVGRRPVVLVVDVVRAFVGDQGSDPEASRARWPLSCGPAAWAALPRIEELLLAARDRGVPVVYTIQDDTTLGGATRAAATRPAAPLEAQRIPDRVAPQQGEVVLPKSRPSAFFGTPLAALLVRLGADRLIVSGCTTSGCVRATTVDAYSMGWPVLLAEEACFDRARLSHDVSLFELNAKYASVVPVAQLTTALSEADPRP